MLIHSAGRVALAPVLAAVMAAPSCTAASSPAAPTPGSPEAPAVVRRIVVLGDSLAVSPSRTQNFVSELQARLTGLPGWTIVNAGVSGDTTAGGLRRFDEQVTRDTGILVLALGANDGLRGVPIATVEANLSAMIERAQARGIRVLLCGMETPPSNGWTYSRDFHRLFPRLAERYGVPLVPFLLAGVALDPDMNGADGFHPNAAGARRIADNVWPYLEPLLRARLAGAAERQV